MARSPASGTPKCSRAARAPLIRGLPDTSAWYTWGVKASGDQVVWSRMPAHSGLHQLPERVAPGPLVRRVDQHPVDVEDGSPERFRHPETIDTRAEAPGHPPALNQPCTSAITWVAPRLL